MIDIIEFHVPVDLNDDLLEREASIIENLDFFKVIHPGFNYTIVKEEVSHSIIVKQIRLNESIN